MTATGLAALYARGGVTFIVIVSLSAVALAVGLERWYATWTYKKRLDIATTRILGHLQEGNRTMAQAVNATLAWHPATPLFALLLDEKREGGVGEVKRLQQRIVRRVRRRLWLLASIGAIAPFVGLFGTVVGVMEAFQHIAEQGTGGFPVVSAGISSALIATAGGIFVGIESVLLFNYLQVYVGEYTALLKESAEEVLEQASEVPRAISSAEAR
jgi:biopolymer transport protein ExbB/TolQ